MLLDKVLMSQKTAVLVYVPLILVYLNCETLQETESRKRWYWVHWNS